MESTPDLQPLICYSQGQSMVTTFHHLLTLVSDDGTDEEQAKNIAQSATYRIHAAQRAYLSHGLGLEEHKLLTKYKPRGSDAVASWFLHLGDLCDTVRTSTLYYPRSCIQANS